MRAVRSGELIRPGEVWLVGAGPGDPDLLTRKAEQLISAADVIFHDALVSQAILALARSEITLTSVGKRSGRHSVDQEMICEVLAKAARKGLRVVRLKGGDPSVFGRSAEEATYLRQRGIAVHICPGITAASAAVANAGCALTARGLSQRVQFVTARAGVAAEEDVDWQAIAAGRSTIAVYMGRAEAARLASQLIDKGLQPDTPALVAVDVSLASERLLHTRLDLLGVATGARSERQPVVLVIGKAVEAPPPWPGDLLQPAERILRCDSMT